LRDLPVLVPLISGLVPLISAILDQPDQYRATMMIATTMNAAISERNRSSFFDRGASVASSGGMTLRRRCEFADEPAVHVGFHRIAGYDHGANATAVLAFEGAVVEAGRSCLNF
jgi:hypothetical protein